MVDEAANGLPIIVLGGGGHARVLADALGDGAAILGVAAPDAPAWIGAAWIGADRGGLAWLGNDDAVLRHDPRTVLLANGVGDLRLRRALFEGFKARGYRFATIRHPSAVVAAGVELGEGVQVFAGTVVQPGTCVGENALLNTRCSIDHDCNVGAHVHVAPGAVICGGVHLETGAFIGAGATVINGIRIGECACIGAGAVVVRDVRAGSRMAGVPARAIQ